MTEVLLVEDEVVHLLLHLGAVLLVGELVERVVEALAHQHSEFRAEVDLLELLHEEEEW